METLLQGAASERSCTPARETTRSGTSNVFDDTWPTVNVYDYLQCEEQMNERPAMQPTTPSQGEAQNMRDSVQASHRENTATITSPTWQRDTQARQLEEPEATRDTRDYQQMPKTFSPGNLQPIMERRIGLGAQAMHQVPSRVFGGIAGANSARDSEKTMFKRKSQKAAQIDTTGPKELVDTVVPKMTVEEQLKFVDLEFVQEVEKFVEVPEVFYNDVIVEVPQVIEVIKVVPKEEIRENITYVPRFETKYIPKYVEVPIIKIVDRYEEVDEIHEILKPVVKKSVVDCPQGVLKKVANPVLKKVIVEKRVPNVQVRQGPDDPREAVTP
ncbi:alveolin domain-containing protein, intermediate filament IMC15 [Cyclospora cayetanensis]|uniref:Alveolin domain-containing protein, intermediate filament IMC15 n=1 Tax=Cyclospora cayetanensis TaxID=88456 RepID=A0A1D3CV34_9EIME|nr:alveolin domain-containing protein, intermediate filament IMC15 [Cyclospora cayetanensis]